ncbi:MAG: transglycosylase SLT domain-containing protein [Deltaproteobacteria bacterium]|jgi:hypothetical protein|nr:transglycosylase SLT domain-containing protein [Deltaproteobacteria bacterium]
MLNLKLNSLLGIKAKKPFRLGGWQVYFGVFLWLAALIVLFSQSPKVAFGAIMDFAGEPIAIGRAEVRENIDQELLLLSEAKARVWLTLRRSGRYLPVIDEALKAAKVPLDFRYLPMALANLDPVYRSGARRGLWRLTEAEALAAGLKVDKDLDERLDPVASSQAAANKIASLKKVFGTWTMVLAAFIDPSGATIALTDGEGEKDYYRLFFPEATEKTVSQVIAGKILYTNPEVYGYTPVTPYSILTTKRGRIDSPVSVKALANYYKLDYKTFRALNPHLLSDTAPVGAVINIP